MKTNMASVRVRVVSVAIMMAALAGCVTASEVRDIVRESNADVVAAQFTQDAPLLGGTDQDRLADSRKAQKTAERIQNFIDAHPDRPEVINPLRVRLAVLYMLDGKPNLARATFGEVEAGDWINERDGLILDLHDDLIWWYGVLRRGRFDPGDKERADQALVKFGEALGKEIEDASVRAWFEQTRIRIAVRRAQNFTPGEPAKTIEEMKAALNGVSLGYTGQWAQDSIDDIKKIRDLLPTSCVTSLDAAQRTALKERVGQKLSRDKELAISHWNLMRWYAHVFCYTEQLQKAWVARSRTGELLSNADWITCRKASGEPVDVRCGPTSSD